MVVLTAQRKLETMAVLVVEATVQPVQPVAAVYRGEMMEEAVGRRTQAAVVVGLQLLALTRQTTSAVQAGPVLFLQLPEFLRVTQAAVVVV